jgi:hypothetical protein
MFRKRGPNANQLRAYKTRPAEFNQHECELDWPYDVRYDSSNYERVKEAELRPKQVACTDCGAAWTMANRTRRVSTLHVARLKIRGHCFAEPVAVCLSVRRGG